MQTQERFDKLQQAASDGDEYGLKKHLQYGFLQVDAACFESVDFSCYCNITCDPSAHICSQ